MSAAATAGELLLGIDAGSSSTSWLLQDATGEVVGAGRVGPVSGIDLGDAATALTHLDELVSRCEPLGAPNSVAVGVTGLDAGSEQAAMIAAHLARRLELPAERVLVLGDTTVAYLATFAPGQGVLVYAGTGSFALHQARDGTSVRAGGHGYLIDDAGGGYWIGREALRRLLRRADAVGASPGGPLARAVFAQLGGSDWPSVRAAVYGGGRAAVAALTPLVARAAQRGDADALAVLTAAGTELARLANVVTGRLGQVLPVALAGGVAACGEPLLRPLREALPVGTEFSVAHAKPVEAAALLAGRLASGELSLPLAPPAS